MSSEVTCDLSAWLTLNLLDCWVPIPNFSNLSSSFSARPHFKVSEQSMRRQPLAPVTTSGLNSGQELGCRD